MTDNTSRLESVSDTQRLQTHALLEEFARAWAPGKLAEHAARLPAQGELRLTTLIEMVKLDLERHWQTQKPIPLETYLENYPELGTPATVSPELIQAEFRARQRAGTAPDLGEIARRFPQRIVDILRTSETEASVDRATDQERTLVGEARPLESPSVECPPPRSRYTRLRVHGKGGLGCVWVARDEDLGRDVALKELQPTQVGDADARRRFIKEAQVTGQLEHPNIVPVYEMNSRTEDGQPFYAMRLIQGRTLREALTDYHGRRHAGQAGALELPRLLTMFVNVCQALAYAHARGVVHRDLKPANIVLGDFGEVIVLDWGLAKVVGDPAGRGSSVWIAGNAPVDATVAGSLLGTPAYMAPEQAEGAIEHIDPRTDIYGLGAILFEILTGRAPHQGKDTVEVVRRIVTEPSPSARALDPRVPRALDAICARAMAKARQDRYPTASALAEDVQRFLADEPVSVYVESWPQRLARWARRHKTWAVGVAAALVVGILTMTWAAWQQNRLAQQEREARLAAERAQEQGLRMAAKFASRTVAGEIKLRWQILDAEADDPELREFLLQLRNEKKPAAHPLREKLQAWLDGRNAEHSRTTKAASWFLVNHEGVMLARSPADKSILGQNWAFRDYFHGKGKSFTPGEVPHPIRKPHLSRVFQSKATFQRLTAFSVPVWSDRSTDKVVGVLAMTVELGHFAALQIGKDQVAALIDTREDGIEDQPARGLLLHHPYLAELRENNGGKLPPMRMPPEWLPRLARLRERAIAHFADPAKSLPVPESWEPNYADPVAGPYSGRWLAALEPVLVQERSGTVRDTGWVVVVQERASAGAR